MKPKLPVFDQMRDGNPFEWILKTAMALRQQRAIFHKPTPSPFTRVKPL